jgi:hypothetical protein
VGWYAGRLPKGAGKMTDRQSARFGKPAEGNVARERDIHQLLGALHLPRCEAPASDAGLIAQPEALGVQPVLERMDLRQRSIQLPLGIPKLPRPPLDCPRQPLNYPLLFAEQAYLAGEDSRRAAACEFVPFFLPGRRHLSAPR